MTGNSQREIEMALGIGAGRRARWRWWALAAALIAGVGSVWYFGFSDNVETAPVFATHTVARGDIVVTVTATGSVEPTNMVDISSELSGTLTKVHVDFNDTVKTGQILAQLDTSNLEAGVAVQRANLRAAEARVEKAEAALGEAQRDYRTTSELDERGATSRQSLERALATLETSLADVEVANADVALAAANLKLAETELAKACICSPINGVVLDRQADAGQIVAASLSAPTLFTIAEDLAKMELQVAVDEADIGRLSTGNQATFTVDAFDERQFPAEISQIRYAPQTVDGVVTYLATLNVDNSDLALRPGMTATAEIVVNEISNALVVPNSALRFLPAQTVATEPEGDDNRSGLLGLIMPRRPNDASVLRSMRTVWVLRDGIATEIEIEPGDTDGNFTEIRGGDLAEGDLVVTGQAG